MPVPIPPATPDPAPDRFRDHAAREMAGMFDDVSGRYDLLNALMTLGQDGAWRAAMAREVPHSARTVLDLCTGSGVSLDGLVRPGRLVLGMDVSLRMLAVAAEERETRGWGPRLACADAFRLPLRDGALDAVTVAFGMRNLRPRATALRELGRVLVPGGVLVVLEATAPRPGPLRPPHALFLRRAIPLLGRLSDDPTAYRYLSASIFEFGTGEEFERDLAASGFAVTSRRGFLLGASRLWAAQRLAGGKDAALQTARSGAALRGDSTHRLSGRDLEWRIASALQALFSAVLAGSLAWALVVWLNWRASLHLDPWQEHGLWALILIGLVGFGLRALFLLLRIFGPPPRT